MKEGWMDYMKGGLVRKGGGKEGLNKGRKDEFYFYKGRNTWRKEGRIT